MSAVYTRGGRITDFTKINSKKPEFETLREQVEGWITDGKVFEEVITNIPESHIYKRQGDRSFYTNKSLSKRGSLRYSPVLIKAMEKLWTFLPKEPRMRGEQDFISSNTYIWVFTNAGEVLCGEKPNRSDLMLEWYLDIKKSRTSGLNRSIFQRILFETIDMWTDSTSESEYAHTALEILESLQSQKSCDSKTEFVSSPNNISQRHQAPPKMDTSLPINNNKPHSTNIREALCEPDKVPSAKLHTDPSPKSLCSVTRNPVRNKKQTTQREDLRRRRRRSRQPIKNKFIVKTQRPQTRQKVIFRGERLRWKATSKIDNVLKIVKAAEVSVPPPPSLLRISCLAAAISSATLITLISEVLLLNAATSEFLSFWGLHSIGSGTRKQCIPPLPLHPSFKELRLSPCH